MGKGIAKFGFKSGFLPKPRPIFKHPIKPVVKSHNPNETYAESIKEPKGSNREPPTPKHITVKELISQTVKEPEQSKRSSASPEAILRAKRAQLRRDYYKESLLREEKKVLDEEQQALDKAEIKKKKEASNTYELSAATKLTLPTITDYLKGPLMRDRTEEEKALLEAKRHANRAKQDLDTSIRRASNLLELYYKSESFIIREDDLIRAVDVAFSTGNDSPMSYKPESSPREYNSEIVDALFGNIGGQPGLERIIEHSNGEEQQLKQSAQQAAAQEVEQRKNEI